ncbi:MAG: aldose epimerase family protein [Lachnospirales bacterium]
MYIILKSSEVEVHLLPYGATIYRIKTKNKNGVMKNICLNHLDINKYDKFNESYLGATIGRVAGRIKNGIFDIDGITYYLDINSKGKDSLHGGENGFDKVLWKYEVFGDEKCVFTYESKDLEGGYPGNVCITVEYILVDNELTVNYYGTSDKNTYLNLTNHSYFNLADDDVTIEKHKLQINATKYIGCDERLIPTDVFDIKGTEYDFSEIKEFGNLYDKKDTHLKNMSGYDNGFLLDKETKSDYDLYLKDELSGRTLKIKTSYSSIVLYTYNFPNETVLEDRINRKHCGVAIEPQYPPNAINDDRFFIPIVNKDNPYKETIKYKFN